MSTTERRSGAPINLAVATAQLRRLRTERHLALAVATIVLITAFVFALLPMLFNRMADDGLAHTIADSSPIMRNIQLLEPGRIDAGNPDITQPVVERGQFWQDSLPQSVQNVIGSRAWVIDTPRYRVDQAPGAMEFGSPRYVTLRLQQDVDQHITLVAGRMPVDRADTLTISGAMTQEQPIEATIYELAVSVETARQLNLTVGQQLILDPFMEDALVRSVARRLQAYLVVEVVGLFNVNDVDEEVWLGFPAIDRAVEYDDGNRVHYYATGLMAPEGYARYQQETVFPLNYFWRYFVDTSKLSAGNLSTLAADIRRLEAEHRSTSMTRPGELGFSTGLSPLFRTYLGQRGVTESVLSLALMGLLAVALTVIALMAAHLSASRQNAFALIRGRGARLSQMQVAQLVEALLIVLSPAAIGYGLAWLLIGGRQSIWSPLAVGVVVVGSTLFLLWSARNVILQGFSSVTRPGDPRTRVSSRRLVFEFGLIALAIAGVYLLRRRGLTASSSAVESGGWDPFLAAVPVLLGIATGLIVLRLFPLPVRLGAWLASLRRDLIPALGLRRIGRQPGSYSLPLLVLLLAVAVGVFASIVMSTISDGQIQTSWQNVGADYRIRAANPNIPLPNTLDISDVPGIEAVAGSYLRTDVRFGRGAGIGGTTTLHGLDTVAYTEVMRDAPVALNLPAAMLEAPRGTQIGSETQPIPAVITNRFTNNRMDPGATFVLNVQGTEMHFVVVDVIDRFPGMPLGQQFVIAQLATLQAASASRELRPTVLYARGDADAGDQLASRVASQSAAARVVSRHVEYAKVNGAPLIAGVQNGFAITMICAGLYSALAIVFALLMSARARARDQAFLRTLGMSRRQTIGLIVTEHVPFVLVALIGGAFLGYLSARLIIPALSLQVFIGEGLPVVLHLSWINLAVLALALIATIATAIAVTTLTTLRSSVGSALRLGEDV